MKRYRKKIYAGISGRLTDSGEYEMKVDLENNSEEDIIKFLKPYRTKLDDNTYWFGYKYNEGIQDKKLYKAFIEFIKNVQDDASVEYRENEDGVQVPYSPNHITESEIDSMVIRALKGIRLSKYDIDLIVYPESRTHNIVQYMIESFKRYFNESDSISYIELKKLAAKDIELDRKKFVRDLYNNEPALEGMSLDTIYDLSNELEKLGNTKFSIREHIHPKELRKYVKKIFEMESAESLANAQKVLIVDDFKTSGTTIRDIISHIEKHNTNPDLEIFIFTLMGNFKD